MIKRIEPLLKKIARISVGDDGGGILSMLKNLLGTAGLGGLGTALSTLGTAAAALTTAVTSFALGKTFFDNVVSPAMDRLFQKNLESMNKAYTTEYEQRTNQQGEKIGLTEDGRVTSDPDKIDRPISESRQSGVSPFAQNIGVEGAEVAAPLAEFAEGMGLGPLFSTYITPLNDLEGRIYSRALKIAQPGGNTSLNKDALTKLVNDYGERVYRLRYDERIRKQVGKEKVDAVVNAILRSPFYQSLELAAAGNEALFRRGDLNSVGAPSFISNEDKTDMGVESAPFCF